MRPISSKLRLALRSLRPLALSILALGSCRAVSSPAASHPGALMSDVRTFGARGDGLHDDTAAIQAALDSGGGRPVDVRLPPGTYNVCARGAGQHALYVRFSNIRILGSGPKRTVIRFFSSGCRDPVTE